MPYDPHTIDSSNDSSSSSMLPFVVGFFFAFRLFIMLLSVRVLGTDPRTGTALEPRRRFPAASLRCLLFIGSRSPTHKRVDAVAGNSLGDCLPRVFLLQFAMERCGIHRHIKRVLVRNDRGRCHCSFVDPVCAADRGDQSLHGGIRVGCCGRGRDRMDHASPIRPSPG